MISAKSEVVSHDGASESLPPTEIPLLGPPHAGGLPHMAEGEETENIIVDLYRYQPAARSAHPEAFKVKTSNYSHAVEGAERGGVLERMKRVRSIEDLGKCVERTKRASCCGIKGCNMAENMKMNVVKKK